MKILSRVELSADRKKATLFYLEPFPASARPRVTFDSTGLTDLLGRPVDGDGDGQPGGILTFTYDTAPITAVPATGIIGHVYASERAAGGGDVPLAGALVRVVGSETLFTFTAADGSFALTPCPAGRFFVEVDGRTCPVSHFPDGGYYPYIVKAWEALPGRADNLAAGTGKIYLPLVAAATLQPVSATQMTTVSFPPAVIAANPALAGVEIYIPANSLFADDGTRGGKVGLAPVASDRLPEPLPPGLNHALDISIQTDGPTNFDRPVPVRFPNLPDPVTGIKLKSGEKSALWSFNHDKGAWEIAGPMTVTDDGNFVVTDVGVGVRQPGWHGAMPGFLLKLLPFLFKNLPELPCLLDDTYGKLLRGDGTFDRLAHQPFLSDPDVVESLQFHNAEVQQVDDGVGQYHLDRYAVKVRLPPGIPATKYLNDMMADQDSAVQTLNFRLIGDFNREPSPSPPKVGDVYEIHSADPVLFANWEDVSVMLTEKGSDHFVFTTLNQRDLFSVGHHVLNGSREWGFQSNGDGTTTFYNRGISNFYANGTRILDFAAGVGIPIIDALDADTKYATWSVQDQLWRFHANGLAERIKSEGGEIVEVEKPIRATLPELPVTDCDKSKSARAISAASSLSAPTAVQNSVIYKVAFKPFSNYGPSTILQGRSDMMGSISAIIPNNSIYTLYVFDPVSRKYGVFHGQTQNGIITGLELPILTLDDDLDSTEMALELSKKPYSEPARTILIPTVMA